MTTDTWNKRTGRTCASFLGIPLADSGLVQEINALYWEVWEPLRNYFMPSAKLISKDRHGAKLIRRHDAPLTPCERLLACPEIPARQKSPLRQRRAALDPFLLPDQLEQRLRRVLTMAHHSSRPAGSLRCAPKPAIPLTTPAS
jgi:hypothetical protein